MFNHFNASSITYSFNNKNCILLNEKLLFIHTPEPIKKQSRIKTSIPIH
jgi:hypothetical protein